MGLAMIASVSTYATQSALSILRSSSREIEDSQRAIATGLTVSTAADNPAIWALNQSYQSDIESYAAIGATLTSGAATVSVGRASAEEVSDLLTDIQTKITAASSSGADTTAIQAEIDSLVDQVEGLVAGASFQGVNLVNGSAVGSNGFSVSSSADGSSSISVDGFDLSADAAVFGSSAVATVTDYFSVASAANIADGASQQIDIQSATVASGASYQIELTGGGTSSLGTATFQYVAQDGDTAADVAEALETQIDDYIAINGLSSELSVSYDSVNARITLSNVSGDGGNTFDIANSAATGGTSGGVLAGLNDIDVTSSAGRSAAAVEISTMIDAATEAAASLGAAESRVQGMADYYAELQGIVSGAMADVIGADREAEATRIKALDAQRALAIEMLAISNANNERILSLFRSA